MIGRVDSIDNTTQSESALNSKNEKSISKFKEDIKEVESLNKDELSAEELKEELKEKIDDLNNITETLEEKLAFKLHDKTERIMTQVIDIKTKEVIKEMPPEEMLDLAAKIHEMVGLIIDEKV